MIIERSTLLTAGLAVVASACCVAASTSALFAAGQKAPTHEPQQVVHVITSSDDSATSDGVIKRRFVIVGDNGSSESVVFPGLSRKRGYLGVRLVELTPELRRHFGVPSDVGVMISKIVEDSPAEKAGLAPGDIVTAIDGRDMESSVQVERTISTMGDGTAVNLEVWRGGTMLTLPATIVERERPVVDLGQIPIPDFEDLRGRVLVDPDQIREHVIRIDPEGLEDALHQLELRVESPEFLEKFQALGQSRLELQQRIADLEERLKDLELQLDRLPED